VQLDDDQVNNTIAEEIRQVGDTVTADIAQGRLEITEDDHAKEKIDRSIKKSAANSKRLEIEEQLRQLLKQDMITRKEYDARVRRVSDNLEMIEDAVGDDE